MSRHPSRLLVPVLVLLTLFLLVPGGATAQPWGESVLSAAERPEATPGLFSQFWSLLSTLCSDNGPGLDPNGATGDTGSGLEPNG